MSYECDKCGTDVPDERKKVARFFANLCVTCASNMDSTLETGLTIVPSHKQLNYLNRLLLAGETGRKRISLPLTKGEAYDLINKITEAS